MSGNGANGESAGSDEESVRRDGGAPASDETGAATTGQPAQQGTDEGVVDLLQRDSTMSVMKYHVAVFGLLSLGLLIVSSLAPDFAALYGLDDLAQAAGGEMGSSGLGMVSGTASSVLVGVFMLLFVFICGPVVATVLGIVTGVRGDAEEKILLLGSGVGSGAGYLLMFALILFLSGTQIPLGSVQLGAVLSNGAPLAIASGVVAAGATWVTQNL